MTGPDNENGGPAEPERSPERNLAAELRLRPAQPPVTRLSRRVLMGLGGGAAIVIVGALVWGLHSQKGGGPASKELYNTDNKPPAGQLAGLPHDYASKPRSGSGSAGVPELGPRLPGDLGRPILNAGAPAPVIGASGQEDGSQSGAQSQAEKRRDQAEQRRAQEVDAARISPLFSGRAGASAEAGAALPAVALPAAGVPIPSTGQQNEADRKLAFLNGPLDRQTVSGSRIEPPAGRNIVQAGAVIAAALITGVRSDLPGQVTAQVTEPVYDSPTGKILLIPQGSRLIGQYDAQVQFGQSRALLAWTRLILPNGRSIVLERQPGADPEGYAGLGDQVDDHWGQLFKAAMLSTLLSVGTEAGTSNNENSLVQAIREGASNSFVQTGSQVVGRSLSIQPSITVRPGFPVRVIVTRDLVLEPYKD